MRKIIAPYCSSGATEKFGKTMKNKKLLQTAPMVNGKKNLLSRACSILLQWCNGKIIETVYFLLQTAPGCFFSGVEQKKAFFTLENAFAPYCSRCSRGVEEKIEYSMLTTPYIENCPGRGGADWAGVEK
ncbi:MAG: hypothetical protein E7054_07130 [Lentisphaerae bacterium]|nr:hypothetical protein [Lentisphaerota bacterium]